MLQFLSLAAGIRIFLALRLGEEGVLGDSPCWLQSFPFSPWISLLLCCAADCLDVRPISAASVDV